MLLNMPITMRFRLSFLRSDEDEEVKVTIGSYSELERTASTILTVDRLEE